VDGGGVADGEFVVAGSEGSVVFERVDTAFDGVAVFVDRGVERVGSSALGAGRLRCPAGSAGVGMVALIRWSRSRVRFAREEYALSASTRSGRRRGAPTGLAMVIAFKTVVNSGLSPACLPVRWNASTPGAWWSSRPLERPSP